MGASPVVYILTHIEDLGGLPRFGSEDAVIARSHNEGGVLWGGLSAQDQDLPNKVSRIVGSVKNGLSHSVYAVFHHPLTLQVNEAKRKSPDVIFSSLNFVAGIFYEKIRPLIKVVVVECLSILCVQMVDLELQVLQHQFVRNGR